MPCYLTTPCSTQIVSGVYPPGVPWSLISHKPTFLLKPQTLCTMYGAVADNHAVFQVMLVLNTSNYPPHLQLHPARWSDWCLRCATSKMPHHMLAETPAGTESSNVTPDRWPRRICKKDRNAVVVLKRSLICWRFFFFWFGHRSAIAQWGPVSQVLTCKAYL